MLIDFKLYFVVIYLPTEHLGVLKNSLKRVRAFQMELDWEVLVKEWGKQEVPGEKLGVVEKTNNKPRWVSFTPETAV